MSTKKFPTKTATPATTASDDDPPFILPPPTDGFTRRDDLTPQIISLARQSHLFVSLESEVLRQPMPGIARSEDGTVPVVWVRDLISGDRGLLLCTTVLLGVFERMGVITGKRIEIVSGNPRPGKQYRDVHVWEVE